MERNVGESLSTSESLQDRIPASFTKQLIGRYEKKVQDHNFGCLIRTDATKEYEETNTMFGRQLNVFCSFLQATEEASTRHYSNPDAGELSSSAMFARSQPYAVHVVLRHRGNSKVIYSGLP
jgi:hypothetical protein